MLNIQKISVSVDSAESGSTIILKNCSLQIKPGETHVLMGPNGSGKSSLVYSLMGHPAYTISSGKIDFLGEDLLKMSVHARSQKGLYLSMQQSQEITGLQVLAFLKEIYAIHHDKLISASEFIDILRPLLVQVGLSESMLYRSVNDGFSGGEKSALNYCR